MNPGKNNSLFSQYMYMYTAISLRLAYLRFFLQQFGVAAYIILSNYLTCIWRIINCFSMFSTRRCNDIINEPMVGVDVKCFICIVFKLGECQANAKGVPRGRHGGHGLPPSGLNGTSLALSWPPPSRKAGGAPEC